MIPATLIVVLIVALASFVLGLTALRRAIRTDRELHQLPPAERPGAGWLHAAMADGVRLCTLVGGLATVSWRHVDCPDCLGVMKRLGGMDL